MPSHSSVSANKDEMRMAGRIHLLKPRVANVNVCVSVCDRARARTCLRIIVQTKPNTRTHLGREVVNHGVSLCWLLLLALSYVHMASDWPTQYTARQILVKVINDGGCESRENRDGEQVTGKHAVCWSMLLLLVLLLRPSEVIARHSLSDRIEWW